MSLFYLWMVSLLYIGMQMPGASGCEEGDTLHNGQCYAFHSEKKMFEDAEKACISDHPEGHLAAFHSEEEYNFLTELIGGTKNVWVGLNRLDGTWNFTDGSDYDFIPSDQDFSGAINEKCARLKPHITDINCDREYQYLCSYRSMPQCQTRPGGNGWKEGDTCKFPFNYRGKMYDRCITLGETEYAPWCYTVEKPEITEHAVPWGYCDIPSCPWEACETTHGGNGWKVDDDNKAPICKFPFNYRGNMYDKCITLGDTEYAPWCYTEEKFTRTTYGVPWGYCVPDSCDWAN